MSLVQADHREIPAGTAVGYGKLNFGAKIGNISETEQVKDIS